MAQTQVRPPETQQEDGGREPGNGRRWRLPRTFEALQFAPFRWYVGAIIWWNAAMSMQMLVRGYLAYQLTDTFTSLGVVGLGSAIPMLLLSPFGGVIADRSSKRLVLQVGQSFGFLIAVVIGVLLFADLLRFWHLVAGSVAQGVMMALVMPSRQAYLPEVVGMRRLMNAIPLQTAGMNTTQILAPALGGFMIDWIGAGSVYVFMAAMYAMSVVMLFGVNSLTPEELEASRAGMPAARPGVMGRRGGMDRTGQRRGTFRELGEGVRYMAQDRTVLSILSFAFLGSVLGMPIRMLLPGYVGAVFGDSGSILGLLQMGMGIGALAGSLWLASLRMERNRGLVLAASTSLMGVFMLAFSFTGVAWLAFITLAAVGIGSSGRQAMSQVLVQEYVDDAYRGRVMSIFMMQFSLMSLSTFFVSLYMEAVGPEFAIGSLGVVLILATATYLALVPRFRRLA